MRIFAEVRGAGGQLEVLGGAVGAAGLWDLEGDSCKGQGNWGQLECRTGEAEGGHFQRSGELGGQLELLGDSWGSWGVGGGSCGLGLGGHGGCLRQLGELGGNWRSWGQHEELGCGTGGGKAAKVRGTGWELELLGGSWGS